MKLVKVETLKDVRLNGRDVPPREIVEIDESLVPAWLQRKLAKLSDNNTSSNQANENPANANNANQDGDDTQDDGVITIEAFEELKADEQKALLAKLEIEGDDSNEEKRLALYTAYLGANKVGDADDAQTGNGAPDGAGDHTGN